MLVNLFREPVGAPMQPDAIGALITAAGRRAGLTRRVTPHQLRHAFGSSLADAGGTIDEIQELLGHVSMTSSQVYLHPDPVRLREAVERVPEPSRAAAARSGAGERRGARPRPRRSQRRAAHVFVTGWRAWPGRAA